MRTVPRTVPGVVSKSTQKGCPKSSFTPVSGQVCGAKPTVTWRLISEGKFGLVFQPIRAAFRRSMFKVTAGVTATAVCGPAWPVSSKASVEVRC